MPNDSTLKNRTIFKYPTLSPLWIAVFIDIIGFSMILPMGPFIADQFGISIFLMGLVLSVNAIFSFFFGPILGKLSDKFGRKRLLLISQFGTFLGFLILAFSGSIWMVIVSRIVDGIFGGNFPIAKAIIGDEVPPKDRGIQMANIGVAFVLGALIGPGIGGILFSLGGIFLPGLFASGLSVITMIVTIIILEETWPKSKRQIPHEIKAKVIIKIRKNKKARFYLTLWGFHTASFMITMTSFSFFAKEIFGVRAFEIGILMTIAGVLRAIVRFTLFKPTIRRLGEENAIKLGLGIFFVSFLIIGFSINIIMLFTMILFISFAASLTRGPLNSKISQSVTPKEQGKINGLSSGLDSFAQIIGPPTGTLMIDFFPPYYLSFIITPLALIPFLMSLKASDLKKNTNSHQVEIETKE
ncbi:MAG TPA: MFS transporter [bacterium]|nr:MFS transporter [bacterium]